MDDGSSAGGSGFGTVTIRPVSDSGRHALQLDGPAAAEDADSGQVGRGNRVGGLIAHARPTSGEAAAGKNAAAHAGKIYDVLSHYLAGRVYARCPALLEVYVHLMARIGEPVDRPWAAVQVILPPGTTLADVEPSIRELMEGEIARLPAFRDEILRGEHGVC